LNHITNISKIYKKNIKRKKTNKEIVQYFISAVSGAISMCLCRSG